MRTGLVLLMIFGAVPQLSAQNPGYRELAESSFQSGDYEIARRNLTLALERATDRKEQVELRRQIAVTYIFEGELSPAKDIYEDLIDEAAAARAPADAHDHYALAAIGALQHKKHEVLKHTQAADAVVPRPATAPMFHAMVWAHVGELDRALKAKADMEAVADTSPPESIARQAAALTRAIYATKIRAFDVALNEMTAISDETLKAVATAFLANATRREGKRVEAAELDAEVRKFKKLNIYSAVVWRLIK